MTPYQLSILLRRMNPELGAKIVQYVDDFPALAELLAPSILARFLNRVEKNKMDSLLSKIPETLKKGIQALSNYPIDCAGSMMETKVTLFHPRDTVARAIEKN